jgi:hypothetical protein
MITCNLMGGLGNQLFQIFTTISYAIKSKNKFYFINAECLNDGSTCTKRYTFWNSLLNKLKPFLVEKIIPFSKNIYQNGFTFNEIEISELIDKDICLQGYFQSEKFFKENYSIIYKMLDIDKQKKQILHFFYENNINETINMNMNSLKNTVSIHFRLGDYKTLQHYHPIMKYEYYNKALNFIQNKDTNITTILYFCEDEDVEIIMETINLLKNDFSNLNFIRASSSLKDWEQLLLMSCCDHNIIANSSFSWWGAYFNTNPNKIVCYPSLWFGPGIPNDTKDVSPLEWAKIEA